MSKNFWRNVFHGSDLSKETGPYVQRIRVNTYPVRLKCPKIPGEWPANHRFARFLWTYWRRASPDFFWTFRGLPCFLGHISPPFPLFYCKLQFFTRFYWTYSRRVGLFRRSKWLAYVPRYEEYDHSFLARQSWPGRNMTTFFGSRRNITTNFGSIGPLQSGQKPPLSGRLTPCSQNIVIHME